MAEETLKNYVLGGMKPYWKGGVKHADAYTPGIADLSGFIAPAGNVFIELKALDKWPTRPGTKVVMGLDYLQKAFLVDRKGWLLCRVRREYLLFDHNDAYWIVDTEQATQGELRMRAKMIWVNRINWKEFSECVAERYD